jgi:transposase
MTRYIGLDVHQASCTLAVVGTSGKRLGSHVVETNGQALVELVRAIPKPRLLCMEEGTQSAWLYELLLPHVDELVVAGVSESRGAKSDLRDAFALAEALRLGTIKIRVFKAPAQFARLRELSHTYTMISRDVVRTQMRIKALFRARGLSTSTSNVYSKKSRELWLSKLTASSLTAGELLFAEFDALRELKKQAQQQLVSESHQHSITQILETCPGLGEIRVAQMVPVVVAPGRFRTARQFWSYSGLGIVMRSSSDWVLDKKQDRWVRADTLKTRGLNPRHNSTLKGIFKGAATTVITKLTTDPLHEHYERMLKQGTKPNLAKLTIARKIAAMALSMWKAREVYDPARQHKQQLTLASRQQPLQ